MATVWSIINDALAMLKDPGPEVSMINVGLMGFLVDWETTEVMVIEPGFIEAQLRYWHTCCVHVVWVAVCGGGGEQRTMWLWE